MEFSFWNERWKTGQIGFHENKPNAQLVKYASRLAPARTRVLVPLAGKSRDVAFLASLGHEVVAVEFVEQAAREFFAESGVVPFEGRENGLITLRHQGVTFLVGDFFAVPESMFGTVGAVFDRAALVALEPDTRVRYAARVGSLVARGARMLLVTFVHDLAEGPPFSVNEEEVRRLYQNQMTLELLESVDVLDTSPRFADRGATFILEQTWFGQP